MSQTKSLENRVTTLNRRITRMEIQLAVKAAEAVKLEAVKPSNRRKKDPWRPPKDWQNQGDLE